MKNKVNDRARGTSPAELRSSGPKLRPERVATTLGVEGESTQTQCPRRYGRYEIKKANIRK